jgi:hypothetical protein
MASAVVETVGGFLRRRQKHLWDTLDLLLGNTSPTADPNIRSIVNELYKQPFITGLIRPTDRYNFEPSDPGSGKPPPQSRSKKVTRAKSNEELRRRHYGPTQIEPREFANALLAVVRTGGKVDTLRSSFQAIQELSTKSAGVIAQADLKDLLDGLESASRDFGALDLGEAIKAIRDKSGGIDSEELKQALVEIGQSIRGIIAGHASEADYANLLSALPSDLQAKLSEIFHEAGNQFVAIRQGIEDWFDRNMAAASEWYRKQTRWFLFIAGLILAAAFNIDAVHAAATLYRDDETRAAVVKVAEQVGETSCPLEVAPSSEPVPLSTDPDAAAAEQAARTINYECVKAKVGGSISLPIGWTKTDSTFGAWFVRIIGWLILAGSVTLGAPFWFDLLRRALNVRRDQRGGK